MDFAAHLDFLIHQLQNVAILVLGVVGYSHVRSSIKRYVDERSERILYGAVLGLLGALSIFTPIEINGGVRVGLAVAPLITATLFCGIPGSAVTLAIILVTRLSLGGIVGPLSALVLIPTWGYSIAALAYHRRRRTKPGWTTLLAIGICTSLTGVLVATIAPGSPIPLSIALAIAPAWTVVATLSVVCFGGVALYFERESTLRAALSESEALLMQAHAIGKIGFSHFEPATGRVRFSESLCRMRSMAPGQTLTLEQALAGFHPDDVGAYVALRTAAISARHDFETDVRIVHPDGSTTWQHANGRPEYDGSGGLVDLLVVFRDITSEKDAEHALRASEERFRALIEHSNDIVLVVSSDGFVTYRSPSAANIFGFDDDEVIGRSVVALIHPGDVVAFERALREITADPDGQARDRTRARRKDGTWRTLAWRARNAATVPGINGIIVNARDVTDSLLLEEKLIQAQKMDAVGQLAGGIAHDFNNILGVIISFSSFLMEDLPAGTPQHDFSRRIAKAGDRGKQLVQQILAFSRHTAVEREPADLGEIVAEVRGLLTAVLPSSTQIDVAVQQKDLVADVNSGQVTQVLLNLCLNANHALTGRPGRITVALAGVRPGDADFDDFVEATRMIGLGGARQSRVTWGALARDRRYARITVADTGVGMNPDLLTRIFDPFFTTKANDGGTGLGLSVVHGVVLSYAGAGMVSSTPGVGTIFTVYIPLTDSGIDQPAVDKRVEAASGRILLVDDDGDLIDVVTLGLRRIGYDVTAVTDPEAAIEMFAAAPTGWDVVISDQTMPSMSGLGLFARLKALQSDLRFILCTGYSDGTVEREAETSGIAMVLLKPVAPAKLAVCVRDLIGT